MALDTYNKTYNDFKLEDLIKMQKLLSTKKTLTPAEASIWLEVPVERVYRLIKENKIAGFHPFGMKDLLYKVN